MCWIWFFLLTASANADLIEECMNYTIYPLQYDLSITPYISNTVSYYHCDITIDVIANAPGIQKIELDAHNLDIREGTIRVLFENRDIVNGPRPFEYDKRNGKLYIYLREPLRRYDAKTNALFVYKIQMTFTKFVREDTPGLFLVKYFDEQTKDFKYIYTSRFSPNKAKYAFPCFDNPRFEAGFNFKVYLPSYRADLQNTNTSLTISEVLKTESAKNYHVIKYMPSSQVALHQVGFHLSQFAHKQQKATQTNDTLFIWAPVYDLHNYNFILSFGVNSIDMIHEFAQTKKPLVNGPINLVAVPTQGSERKKLDGYEVSSWNLLTNSAHRIAYIDQLTSIKQLERMKFELAQQLSRLWLGNPGESRVTRWREEWFKEGMATYMAYYLLSQYNHGEQARGISPLGYYGLRMKHQAMSQDWHHSTPALNNFNNSLAIEIPARYKELVTMKTGAIWWMLENWLETDQLRASFVKHVNKMRGQYISIWELIAAIDKDTIECTYQYFNGTTPSKILQSWFHQAGYPVVTVNVFRDNNTLDTIQLKQHHFSFFPKSPVPSSYWLPISYEAQHRENCFNCFRPRFTLDEQTKVYAFRERLNGGWIILNRNSSGYYRVNYDNDTWRLIAASLNKDPTTIDEMNRAQIVNDVFALYMSGEVARPLAERVLAFLDNERSLLVWHAAIDGFHMLTVEGATTPITKTLYWQWEAFMGKRVKRIFSLLIKNTDSSPRTRLFRNIIVSFASEINYEPCLTYLRGLYREFQGGGIVDPDVRESMWYVHENGTDADAGRTLSASEIEDRATAADRVRQRNRFLIHCPIEESRPMPIIATDRPVTSVPATEKLERHGKATASCKIKLSFVVLLSSVVLSNTIV